MSRVVLEVGRFSWNAFIRFAQSTHPVRQEPFLFLMIWLTGFSVQRSILASRGVEGLDKSLGTIPFGIRIEWLRNNTGTIRLTLPPLRRRLVWSAKCAESSTPSSQLRPLRCHPSNLWRGLRLGRSEDVVRYGRVFGKLAVSIQKKDKVLRSLDRGQFQHRVDAEEWIGDLGDAEVDEAA